MIRLTIILILVALYNSNVYSNVQQEVLPLSPSQLDVQKVTQEPNLALFKEAMENNSSENLPGTKVEGFISRTPVNGKNISEKTLVFLSYDDKNIYSIYMCYDQSPEMIRSVLSSRDKFPLDDDTVALHLVTFEKSQQMYGFQSNAAGSQIDGMYSEGKGWDLSLNPVWFTESIRTNNGYLVKIKIPLSSLRFPSREVQDWGFFVFRGIPRKNEDAFFPQFSSEISSRLSQAGQLSNMKIKSQPLKIETTPFVTAKATEQKSNNYGDDRERNNESDIGVDAKFIWDDRIVMDVTLNPDFSQVESDEPQVVTNQRFAVLFPEKRPFFIENASYFKTELELLSTRKIVDPSAGVRITGQIGDWALAGMVINDEKLTTQGTDATDGMTYVTNVRKTIAEDSLMGVFISDYSKDGSDFKNVALQTRYRIDEKWLVNSQLAFSNSEIDNQSNNGDAFYLSLDGSGEFWNYTAIGQRIAEDFEAPLGFIRRKGITDLTHRYSYRFLETDGAIISYTTEFENINTWNTKGDILDQFFTASIKAELPGQTFVKFETNKKEERLDSTDYNTLNDVTKFDQNLNTISIESLWFSQLGFSLDYSIGDAINYQPANDKQPELSNIEQIIASITYRAASNLQIEVQFIESKLNSVYGVEIFSSTRTRLKGAYQLNPDWSLRLILDKHSIYSNTNLSSINNQDTVVADLLLKWETTPGNALYFGYGNFRDEYDNLSIGRQNIDRGKSIFLKFSHRLAQ